MLILSSLKSRLARIQGQRELLCGQRSSWAIKKGKAEQGLADAEAASAMLFVVAQQTQQALALRITTQANIALDALFPGRYALHIDFVGKRGQMEADIYLESAEGSRLSPLDSVGGGVVDVLTFTLRLACILLANNERSVFLDEPFRYLSADKQATAASLLELLRKELGFSFLYSSHDPSLVPEGVASVDVAALTAKRRRRGRRRGTVAVPEKQ